MRDGYIEVDARTTIIMNDCHYYFAEYDFFRSYFSNCWL